MTPTPESHYHTAAVCQTEAAIRRASPLAFQREFAAVLDTWADNAQRRGDEVAAKTQRDLFA
jgi:hypothetical protein